METPTNESETVRQKVLLVEDDAELARMVAEFLHSNQFDVLIEGRGDTAAGRILSEQPEAVILDVNLPGLDGFSVCKSIRDQYRGAIIMLTARGEDVDEVLGLEAGADDYMAKPVRPRVLLARLKTHLRRISPIDATSKPIVIGTMVVDAASRGVEIDGARVEVTTAEFDLLRLLAQHAGKTLSRNEIYQEIHGMPYDGMDRSIDLRISRLRKKIGDDPSRPQRIKSVRGVGYMLAVDANR